MLRVALDRFFLDRVALDPVVQSASRHMAPVSDEEFVAVAANSGVSCSNVRSVSAAEVEGEELVAVAANSGVSYSQGVLCGARSWVSAC